MKPFRPTSHQGAGDSENENDTDYGLEFSTSRLLAQNANNRRSSTLQSTSNSQGGETGAAGSAPRQRKQRGPMSRATRLNREIRRLRACTTPLIPRLSFSRLVRELITKYASSSFRITESALGALQESSELYLTQRFQDAYLLTHHRGRVTLEVRDMGLMAYIIDVTHNRS
uniref:Cid3 n=1 Tax=Drosophila diplacantha TaxID=61426 RepID=A0A1V0HRN6_9MUSC|nr:Cid3 [Drosophila diplacantha]